MKCISYKGGYKYQLSSEYKVGTGIKPEQDVEIPGYIELNTNGDIIIKPGYAWDGPSGPTIDTANFMRGSLVHDALYQLMRNNKLNSQIHRKPADKLLQQMCKQDGMTSLRAWWVYQGVRFGGKQAASTDNRKKKIVAPKSCRQEAADTYL